MKPVESSFVAFVSVGEGWHNYHHAFPWDYRAAELGSKYSITTFVIDALAYFGLAYDLKSTPYHMVQRWVFYPILPSSILPTIATVSKVNAQFRNCRQIISYLNLNQTYF